MGLKFPRANFWDNCFDIFQEIHESSSFNLRKIAFTELGMFVNEQGRPKLSENFCILWTRERSAHIQKSWVFSKRGFGTQAIVIKVVCVQRRRQSLFPRDLWHRRMKLLRNSLLLGHWGRFRHRRFLFDIEFFGGRTIRRTIRLNFDLMMRGDKIALDFECFLT